MSGKHDSVEGASTNVNADGAAIAARVLDAVAAAFEDSPAETSAALVRVVTVELGAAQALALVRESAEQEFDAVAADGLDAVADRAARYRFARRAGEWVARTGKPMLVSDPRVDARFPDPLDMDGAAWIFPLSLPAPAAGALVVFDGRALTVGEEVARRSALPAVAAALGVQLRAETTATRLRDTRRQYRESERRRLQAEQLASAASMTAEMAREIQVPLASLRILAARMRDELPEGDPGRASLSIMIEESARMERVLGDQIELVQACRPELRPEDLNRLLAECLLFVDKDLKTRSLRLTRRLASDLPPLLLDPGLMRRIFLNMLRSGIADAPRGGRVKVETKRRGDALEVVLAMDGTRLAGQVLEEIWRPFGSDAGGAGGVGTAAMERIVREHRGTLRVSSNRDWPLVFSLRLPIPGNLDRRRSLRERRTGGQRRAA